MTDRKSDYDAYYSERFPEGRTLAREARNSGSDYQSFAEALRGSRDPAHAAERARIVRLAAGQND